jgi:glycosyltransferase involved in cell wall biosynthesis
VWQIRIAITVPKIVGGGAENSMRLLATEFTLRGHEVCYFPIESDEVLSHPSFETYLPFKSSRSRWFRLLATYLKFCWKFSKFKPHFTIINCEMAEFVSSLIPSTGKIITVLHNPRAWRSHACIGKLTRKILKFRNSQWVAVSSHLKSQYESNFAPILIPNPISYEAKVLKNSLPKIQRIVFIGRLVESKKPQILLRLSKEMQIPALIIGSGVLRNSLILESKTQNLAVSFIPHCVDPWAYISCGDILIVPSEYEGDGLVAVEGIVNEMPLLVSSIPEFRRFQLFEDNYFSTENDLYEKIMRSNGMVTHFLPPQEAVKTLRESRNIHKISDYWLQNLLRQE